MKMTKIYPLNHRKVLVSKLTGLAGMAGIENAFRSREKNRGWAEFFRDNLG